MTDYGELLELEVDDAELVPEILPVDARLSVSGLVSSFMAVFERGVSIAPIKEIIPGSSYVNLSALPNTNQHVAYVQLTAIDTEKSLSVVMDGVTVYKTGSVLFPGKKILEILKLCPTDKVRIDVLGNTATIRSGRAQWTVQTPVGDSLPPFPDVSDIVTQPVPRLSFLKALRVARAAVSSQSARFALMQVQVKNQNVTGCDGARIHRVRVEELPDTLEAEIPIKVVDELIRGLESSDSEAFQLGSDDLHLLFEIDEDRLIAQRLIVGYPDIETLMLAPAFTNKDTVRVSRSELVKVIKRVRVNADADSSSIFLDFTPGEKVADGTVPWNLVVKSRDKLGNASQESLEIEYSGASKSRSLCFNHKHLVELLTALSDDTAIFKLGDDTKSKKTNLLLTGSSLTGVCQQMRPDYLA